MTYKIAIICGPDNTWFPEGTIYGALDDAIAALIDALARGREARVIRTPYADVNEGAVVVDIPPLPECHAIAWGALTLAKYLPRSKHRNEDGSEQVLMKSGRTILHRHAVPGQPVRYWTSMRDMNKRYPNDREI